LEWGSINPADVEIATEDEAAYFARVDGYTAKFAATPPLLTAEAQV
jgi:hypothetical protein